MHEERFWQKKRLDQFSREEWEAVCDGCGKCCLFKLAYSNPDEICYTNVVCRLLNLETCRCTDYANRRIHVPTCLILDLETVRSIHWLPKTCAYRRLLNGEDLLWWHHLMTGDPTSVIRAGVSICNKAISEEEADMSRLEDYIVHWVS